MNERLNEMNYDELRYYVTDALSALQQRTYNEGFDEGFKQGKFDAELDRIDGLTTEELSKEVEKENRERRNLIVERAKADVSRRYYGGNRGVGRTVWKDGAGEVFVKFYVNKVKRTIVAVLELAHTGGFSGRGIAKAHPDDCFNVHIGKAIALRRALGENVPKEYLNAPQPTEARVGDVIKYECDRKPAKVVKEFSHSFYTRSIDFVNNFKGHEYKIIDDSRGE